MIIFDEFWQICRFSLINVSIEISSYRNAPTNDCQLRQVFAQRSFQRISKYRNQIRASNLKEKPQAYPEQKKDWPTTHTPLVESHLICKVYVTIHQVRLEKGVIFGSAPDFLHSKAHDDKTPSFLSMKDISSLTLEKNKLLSLSLSLSRSNPIALSLCHIRRTYSRIPFHTEEREIAA